MGIWEWFTKEGDIEYKGKYKKGTFLLEDEKGHYKDIGSILVENKLLTPEIQNILKIN